MATGANLLVNITNDSWSGVSPELQQHSAMAIFRAVETRRCLASAATTGITGMVEPTGRMHAIQPYREDVQFVTAQLRTGKTIYVRFGDWFVGLCGLWLAVGSGWIIINMTRTERNVLTPNTGE